MRCTAVFDIGKTNKKFLLFGPDLQILHEEKTSLPETTDEDGFPTEDLDLLTTWMRQTLARHREAPRFDIEGLNVSTYGASLVHLDENREPVAPLYNYLKPFPEDLASRFYRTYGPKSKLARETASPALGMLNSGLQLYWIKQRRPALFRRIKTTLHLPQYLAFLFSGVPAQEYTSLGCHTALWQFEHRDYHPWVARENLVPLFPAVGSTYRSFPAVFQGKALRVGTGVHDSSAALLPYLRHAEGPFLLLSTGTWSIALDPFSGDALTAAELARDALFFLRPDGGSVKASRLFLGREHDAQVELLARHFDLKAADFPGMPYRPALARRARDEGKSRFHWAWLEGREGRTRPPDLPDHFTPAMAYHQLMAELVAAQVEKVRLLYREDAPRLLFVDGGFSSNQVFIHQLAEALPSCRIQAVVASQGSALGAALCLRTEALPPGWLDRHYSFQRIE